MPVKQDSINRELYGILKSRGYRPDMFTSAGKKVAIPDEAEAFQFDFVKDGVNYGKVTATVDGLHRLILYYGDDVENSPKADGISQSGSDESFTSLRKLLKRFAKNKQLGFELSDIDDLEADMAKREYTQKDKLSEGYYALGKMKSYSDNVPSTKIILQHNRQIEEGEQRYRNVAKIFVENALGERFLVPTNKPGLARVYARHIAEGGTPYDERGQHITSLCEEYSKMAGFVRATKNKQFNESVQSLINEGVNHYVKLRETLHKMAGKRGYNEYFENYTPALMEDEGADLSEMFMQSSLDPRIESVMPILSKLSKNISETTEMAETLALESWADEIITHKGGKVTKTPTGIKHQAGPDQYGGSLPDEEEQDTLKKSQINKTDKELGVKFDRTKKYQGGIKVDETNHDDDEDDGLIAGRYTQDEWDRMVNRVKQLAHKQEAEKRKQEHEQPVKEADYDPFTDDPEADAKHEQEVRAQMQQQLKQGKGTSLKDMNPLERNQYLQSTGRQWDDKTQRSVPVQQQKAQQPQNEGLDADQKSVGQLGPTEKITKSNPTRGKLVGVNESEGRPYVCVHAKKGKCDVTANSSYEAAQKAASKWGLKSTSGIDVHVADKPKDTASLEEGTYNDDVKRAFPGGKASGVKTGASAPKSGSHISNLSDPITNSVTHHSSGKEIGLITKQPDGKYYAHPSSVSLAHNQGGTFATPDEAHQFIRNAHAKAMKNGTLSPRWLKKQPLPQFAKKDVEPVKEGQEDLDAILRIIRK